MDCNMITKRQLKGDNYKYLSRLILRDENEPKSSNLGNR